MSAGIVRNASMVAGVTVRILKSEAHNLSGQATQYPVESGKSIADHVILNPNVVDIRFEMPNSGVWGPGWARAIFQKFVDMRDRREPVILDTEHGRYKNMVLVSFTPDHRAPFKGAFAASVRLQQVGIVGEKESVSAAGGRDPSVLADGSVSKTACAATDGGTAQAVSSGAILAQCMAAIASKGAPAWAV